MGVITLANANSPGQMVLSGEAAALEHAAELARARGATKVVRLPISIASHSPLMARAAAQFGEIVAKLPLRQPRIPVVANINRPDPHQRRRHPQGAGRPHILKPVQWTSSVGRDGGPAAARNSSRSGPARCSRADPAYQPGSPRGDAERPRGRARPHPVAIGMKRVVVTGVGAVTPVGLDAPSTWASMLEGPVGDPAR